MILEIAGQRDLTPSSTGTYFFFKSTNQHRKTK